MFFACVEEEKMGENMKKENNRTAVRQVPGATIMSFGLYNQMSSVVKFVFIAP